MQQTTVTNSNIDIRGGGRIASDQYRQSLSYSEEFTGLDENTNRYDLLLLVKRVGKMASFTPRMIQLLDYYMAFTTECDWEQGSRPIVFQSLSRTAMDLGVTERQVQNLEKQLFELGAITWNDSGNHKRYGQRDRATGRLLYAYGVELTPLAFLKPELEAKLHEKQLYAQTWQATKREISSCRRQMRSLLLECQMQEASGSVQAEQLALQVSEIAIQLRTHIKLDELRNLLERHRSLHGKIEAAMGVGGVRKKRTSVSIATVKKAAKSSYTSEPKCIHNKYTNLINNNCSPSSPASDCGRKSQPAACDDLKLSAGLQHISRKQVLLVSSDRFKEMLSIEQRPINWNDIVSAAHQQSKILRVSQQSWAQACEVLGREGASIAIVIADRFAQRKVNPVRNPAAYFHGMVNKGIAGELKLHRSIKGLLHSCKT